MAAMLQELADSELANSILLTEDLQEVSGLPFASRPTHVKWLPDAQAKHQLRI
jgi:hypothetical protein